MINTVDFSDWKVCLYSKDYEILISPDSAKAIIEYKDKKIAVLGLIPGGMIKVSCFDKAVATIDGVNRTISIGTPEDGNIDSRITHI